MSYILAYSTVIGACVVFSSSYFAVLWSDKRVIINDLYFIETYGRLTEDIRVDTVPQRLYHLFSFARRILIVSTALYYDSMPAVYSIYGHYALSLVTLIYYGKSAPLK